ncbi:Riboflavin transporter FmnP [Halobacillus alkaliphilus]|uniref:Riboflavin transporter n=1 Tax=Halobacillus alkaliphilus TaxID=396056 RepID=A0A1I2SA81_9BACI|nr:ECF transporter S component [Halobacillus alkaliphilus]SFG46871.1 Riboflavin transporter FmnP [Halobacillus alkaliphilus]
MTLSKLQRTTTIGILAACSIILYYFKFPVPFFPPFLTMDISDIPALVGAITLGPVAGVAIQFLKNLIDYITHGSYAGLPVGQMANFFSGALIVGLIGMFYHYQKKLNLWSFAISITVFLSTMYLLNYYFILPSIMELIGVTKEQYVSQFKQFNPLATNFKTAVLYVIIPFNLLKIGMIYGIGLPFSFRLDRILNSKRKRVHV